MADYRAKGLIVENDQRQRAAARFLLGSHELNVAEDFDEAERLLTEQHFDYVLTSPIIPESRVRETESMPLGYPIVITAINAGIKYVGVLANGEAEPSIVATFRFLNRVAKIGIHGPKCVFFDSNKLPPVYELTEGRFTREDFHDYLRLDQLEFLDRVSTEYEVTEKSGVVFYRRKEETYKNDQKGKPIRVKNWHEAFRRLRDIPEPGASRT